MDHDGRPIRQRREMFGCHELQINPREKCVLMRTDAAFRTRIALRSQAWARSCLHGQGAVLPITSIRANLAFNKQVMGWMSV